MASRGYGGGSGNPFDYKEDYDGGFGGGRSSSNSRSYGSGVSSYGRGSSGYSHSGGGYNDERHISEEDEAVRMQAAYRRMEDSSANSLRMLNEALQMGTDTTVELENQQESLDRTERRLDEIHTDLDRGERFLRKIKSPFGGIGNYFSKKKSVDEITDPKELRAKEAARDKQRRQQEAAKAKQRKQLDRSAKPVYSSTGSAVVDKNLDEMEKMLHQLHGVGEMMSDQLDDSDASIDRIGYKLQRDQDKMERLNKGVKRELYK